MRKMIKNAIVTFLLLALGTSTAFLIYLHFFALDDSDFSGEWTTDLDMTQQAVVTALDWLQDIEGVSFSLGEMESYMQDLTVQVDLTMEQTSRLGGTFRCNIQPESYDACYQAAYEAFARGFLELLGERLRMADYPGDTGQEAVEDLVKETFGMSTVSYLMSYGPVLLPSLEDLQAQYDGNGTYEIAGETLIRQFDFAGMSDTRTERCIRKEDALILLEEPGSGSSGTFFYDDLTIYTLK